MDYSTIRDSLVSYKMPLSAGPVAGDIVPLGSYGLKGYLKTNRATTATIAAGTASQGLANGEATATLLGITHAVTLAMQGAVTQFAKVYAAVDTDGVITYVTTPLGIFVGYALETIGGAGDCLVGIAPAPQELVLTYFVASPADAGPLILPRAARLKSIQEMHAVAGSDGGAVVVMPKKCTGTQATTAGTALISDNTNTGFDCKATALTVQDGTLVTTAATLAFAKGDRLAFDFTGTLTALVGVAFTAIFE